MNADHSLFVSTAIPYVNASPHLGFALEVVLADAFARHARTKGHDVRFTSGTDDHSLKNVRAADEAGVLTRDYVDAAASRYSAFDGVLGAAYDDFVRTSVDPRHVAAVNALWAACARRGDLEKRPYRGLYCLGCEQFYEVSELTAEGLCEEHGRAPELVEEENWFFRLSRYELPIREALTSGRVQVHPPTRANEVLRFVEGGLRDVSVSRSRTRARGWGIPVPGDPEQVVYVWFDALANYLASLGFPDDDARVRRYWHGASRRVHVVGKGIARFHAVLWPAILLAAELPLPTDVWVHGYVTVDGRKIGKSFGNGIDPAEVLARFGVDGLRWFLLRHIGPTNDGDVSEARLSTAYVSELADGLGNLVARTLALVRGACGGSVSTDVTPGIDPSGEALRVLASDLQAVVDVTTKRFLVDHALRAIYAVVAEANAHLARTTPWTLARDRDRLPNGSTEDAAQLDARLRASLGHTVVALEAIHRALAPFLPETAARISDALAHPGRVPPILFPKPLP
jgi:methionyl-tRNA synthetase